MVRITVDVETADQLKHLVHYFPRVILDETFVNDISNSDMIVEFNTAIENGIYHMVENSSEQDLPKVLDKISDMMVAVKNQNSIVYLARLVGKRFDKIESIVTSSKIISNYLQILSASLKPSELKIENFNENIQKKVKESAKLSALVAILSDTRLSKEQEEDIFGGKKISTTIAGRYIVKFPDRYQNDGSYLFKLFYEDDITNIVNLLYKKMGKNEEFEEFIIKEIELSRNPYWLHSRGSNTKAWYIKLLKETSDNQTLSEFLIKI